MIPYSHVFVVEAKSESCRDYQEIRVQELIQNLSFGTIPRSMWVVLEDDLVDNCKPGDDVTICGIMTRRWKSVKLDVSIVVVHPCIARHDRASVFQMLFCNNCRVFLIVPDRNKPLHFLKFLITPPAVGEAEF